MDKSDDKLVTLITGTRKGIGKYLAQYYCDRGHQVFGCSRGEPDFHHPNYSHHRLDVADEPSVKSLFAHIRKRCGRLDHLVNNAGIASMNHSLLVPTGQVRKLLETNVLGAFLFCRESAKLMQLKKSGRIVNFVTVASPLKLEGEAMYAASKSAVHMLTQILCREFADFGITVNAIGPSPIDTDLIRGVPADKIETLLSRQAIRRMGEFCDVSNVVDFFLRKESNFITGQCLYLGGVT